MALVQINVRAPGGPVSATVQERDGIRFCAREECPRWSGQKGLFGRGSEVMVCGVLGYAPGVTCLPYYLETAEALDASRRALEAKLAADPDGARAEIWRRLDEAVSMEVQVARLAQEVGL